MPGLVGGTAKRYQGEWEGLAMQQMHGRKQSGYPGDGDGEKCSDNINFRSQMCD